jgi:hypothetical protein
MGGSSIFSLSLVPACPTNSVGQGSTRFIKAYGVFFLKKAKFSKNFFLGRLVAAMRQCITYVKSGLATEIRRRTK